MKSPHPRKAVSNSSDEGCTFRTAVHSPQAHPTLRTRYRVQCPFCKRSAQLCAYFSWSPGRTSSSPFRCNGTQVLEVDGKMIAQSVAILRHASASLRTGRDGNDRLCFDVLRRHCLLLLLRCRCRRREGTSGSSEVLSRQTRSWRRASTRSSWALSLRSHPPSRRPCA